MARALYTNLASGTLLSGIGSGATSLTLNAGQGSLYPVPTNGDYVWISITDAATKTNVEIVQCTGRVGDVLTVTRGQQSTSALNWLANDIVEIRVTATGMNELWQNALHGSQQFLSSGSFTCPSGVYSVNVTVVGGGGGGGNGYGAFGPSYRTGGGGGGGAFGKAFSVSVTPFSVYSVVVGLGGAAGATGGTSSFTAGLVYSAVGGGGGGSGTSGGPGTGGEGGNTIQNCTILQTGSEGVAGQNGVGVTILPAGKGGTGISSTVGGTGTGTGGAEGYSGGGGGGIIGLTSPSGIGGTGGNGYVLIEW